MSFRFRFIAFDWCPCIERLRKRRRKQAMLSALFRLSPLHQDVFRLIRFDGLTIEAAAHKLSVTPEMVHEALVDVLLALGRANRS